VNEPQAWSAPYNSNTLTMEKNAFAKIRGLAPDTHIMMMSYSQPNNWDKAASACAGLGIMWDNASVAFHTYGIDGKEGSVLTSFYKALQAKGIADACTEPNLTLKAIEALRARWGFRNTIHQRQGYRNQQLRLCQLDNQQQHLLEA
jgi:hypothetical protein